VDGVVILLLIALTALLLVLGLRDAYSSLRRRTSTPPVTPTARRIVLIADPSVRFDDLDAVLASFTGTMDVVELRADGADLRRLAARLLGVDTDSLIVPPDGSRSVLHLDGGRAAVEAWNQPG